ncbi:MAG: ShlB/FhaC/HecB family hemolysin secretion/activation protein [Nitrosomonadaceae bacterium]|nr:ShlB/FhaC/HecB family hemolysin secretion/activation protein [Nitrosomonadaceae bacterium]
MRTGEHGNVHRSWQRNAAIGGIALLCAVSGFGAFAQTHPDAGQLQRDIERNRLPDAAPRRPDTPLIEESKQPAMAVPETARFPVKGFHISRITVFPEAELLLLLKDFVDKNLSLADLWRAADIITRYYHERGYFVARAYIPAQDIKDGIVEIAVLEGTVDRISIKPVGDVRLRDGVIEGTLRSALPAGGLIRKDDLERGLLLLNDLPGVKVRSVLSPGAAVGTSLLTTEVTQAPRLSGHVDFDNYGNKFSGPLRLNAGVNLNDLTGYGDQLSLRVSDSSGVRHGRVAYQLPVGTTGLKMGVAYAELRYELCCEFAALQAHGSAKVSSATALYPLIRSRDFSLYGIAAYDNRHFFNGTISGTTSDKKADVGAFGIQGDSQDLLGSGGINTFGVTLFTGHLNLNGWAADRSADSTTARTQGDYQKLSYSFIRLQRLGEAISFYAALSGQFASKNLDSSEKFSLGGPLGVRAYPQGEAFGDESMLLNLELRYNVTQTIQLAPFFDHGETRLHHNPWDGWQGSNTHIQNRYGLSGYGLGLNWSPPGGFLMRVGVAQRIGSNPGRSTSGLDIDSAKHSPRLWLHLVKSF